MSRRAKGHQRTASEVPFWFPDDLEQMSPPKTPHSDKRGSKLPKNPARSYVIPPPALAEAGNVAGDEKPTDNKVETHMIKVEAENKVETDMSQVEADLKAKNDI
ncbi:hypothetical protein NE237_002999 [Protea cynaroides]|uniref:Uncharacterized protein n=1 Tax=Protea cynaroides TaxID=273540 RepID=A0A9Q0QS65_9MAGN|nr:hypothetical protein NE237_002999 [Protea cynaroides]